MVTRIEMLTKNERQKVIQFSNSCLGVGQNNYATKIVSILIDEKN